MDGGDDASYSLPTVLFSNRPTLIQANVHAASDCYHYKCHVKRKAKQMESENYGSMQEGNMSNNKSAITSNRYLPFSLLAITVRYHFSEFPPVPILYCI
jgi:hypothetical protein